ncbi:tyrosyl-tRNA synthetase [Parvularcula bermudensis HTCC2503]|uniref:Tyrosine--tRNA ligase n=1 Tax=Parvularcula bermudensis (strain ATCC BAA-594 / HTCC2503 / KCTC 12087) TaxID=314260 RepID=E0TDX1_PARBH|nr:tyrosine--tRNA ligase [Parvularcula bermudensis]ADM10420.1 tyrosyl-tRNA synthetase [Parvularcula bermudensis HTCC2503]
MTRFQSDLLRVLDERGFIHQITHPDALDQAAKQGTVTGYIGFDATADSLHAGHLTQIMMLHWLQQTGHRPIALMGGGTTKIGDPSGKDTQRKLLDDATIAANIAGIRQSFDPFLQFGDSGNQALMVNNDDWLSSLGYIRFLRDFGVHFTINRMLTFDSVKLRLDREQPLTFLEFNYMLMQAYDFFELNERYGCTLQMGGSDQWGNIVNGVELCRRIAAAEGAEGSRDVCGLTTPLLTTASGKKMGKTENGAVWLNADRLSPYEYWQYWRNVEDADVVTMLTRFTTLPLDDIQRLGALGGAEINEAKKILATETTALLHGREAAEAAAETARQTFEQGGAADDLPSVTVAEAALAAGLPLFEPFTELGLISSKSEGRRHIKAGALKVNDAPATEEFSLTPEYLIDGRIKLSIGKKKHGLVVMSS